MAEVDENEGPVVSGISPKEGYPGTKVTIRGANLGNNKDDVIGMSSASRSLPKVPVIVSCLIYLALAICGVSCMDTLEYISSKKLICKSPKYVGAGIIVVTTFSGGTGTCNVNFTGLEQPRKPLLGEN